MHCLIMMNCLTSVSVVLTVPKKMNGKWETHIFLYNPVALFSA